MQCAFALRYVAGCLNVVVENELALMDGVWFPVALPWPCFRGQISSKGKKKGWESQRLLGIGSRGEGRL